jgi:hypothetical protein
MMPGHVVMLETAAAQAHLATHARKCLRHKGFAGPSKEGTTPGVAREQNYSLDII